MSRFNKSDGAGLNKVKKEEKKEYIWIDWKAHRLPTADKPTADKVRLASYERKENE